MARFPENAEYLLNVLRAVINGEEAALPWEGVDLREVCRIAEDHRLAAMAYHGLYKLGIDEKEIEPFRICQRGHMLHSVKLEREFLRVSAMLEEAGIPYCPLKGWFTKDLYPDPSMRVMHDVDILIHEEDAPAVRAIMNGLGYECRRFDLSEDDSYRLADIYFEFHRSLEPVGSSGRLFVKDPWSITEPVSGCMRKLELNESYLYTVAHAMKHFTSSGTGLRTLLDIYLFRTREDLDSSYIEKRAGELGIARFMHCMEDAADSVFGGKTPSADTEKLIDFMISCGVVGDVERLRTSNLVRSGRGKHSGSKLSYFLTLLFPSPKTMRFEYKVLFKAPWLLPFTYIARFFSLLFGGKGRLKRGRARFEAISMEEANKLKEIYRISGADE